MVLDPSILALTFNHVVLPSQLPGKHDSNEESQFINADLTRRLIQSVEVLKKHSSDDLSAAWQAVKRFLETCVHVNGDGFVNKDMTLQALKELNPGNAIALYIVQQNACLFVRKPVDDPDAVVFEAFEASPAAEQTLEAEAALLWNFPDQAVVLPIQEFKDPVFQTNLAAFLDQASSESVYEFSAKARKAGVEVSEARDSANPALITQFLMTILATNGERACPPLLQKRIKDDVCWDNAKVPWRRSPFWLILRVCTERLLMFHLGEELGRIHYKFLLCKFMARLLEDSIESLSPQDYNHLKIKLCRRLAKLASETESSTGPSMLAYRSLLSSIGSYCQISINTATNAIDYEWKAFKSRLQRRIPPLPVHAQPPDFDLSLRNSSAFFHRILDFSKRSRWTPYTIDCNRLGQHVKKSTTEAFLDMATRYSRLAEFETAIGNEAREVPKGVRECKDLCIKLSRQIERYLDAVGDAYKDDPEQLSIFVLNLFELWVHMDKCATTVYPLLKKFHPWVKPELLDVLLLSRLSDLERLHKIQHYLGNRCRQLLPDSMTIFSDPQLDCFTDQYFVRASGQSMHQLQERIEADSLVARANKEAELNTVNEQYNALTEKKTMSTCTQRRSEDGSHDIRGCSHCYYVRRRRRLKIGVHEDFLPEDRNSPSKRAIVFELGMPKSFEAYRNATWNIIASLSQWGGSTGEPEVVLEDYSQLTKYSTKNRSASPEGITLASETKSYLGTHYKWKALPASSRNVLLPSGLKFAYYDSRRKIWLKRFPRELSFAHLFQIDLPKDHPFARLYSSPLFRIEGPGPSSYEAVASVAECPRTLTVHEYMANHSLMGGKYRRWLSLILELGSNNLDFGLRDTVAFIRALALQAGPGPTEYDDPRLDHGLLVGRGGKEKDHLRSVQAVFRDQEFCRKLNELLHQHIDLIQANWREANYMETLLTLALQLWAFCCDNVRSDVLDTLHRIRRTTLAWIILLRDVMRGSEVTDTANQAARHCFLSALLCRRTFLPEVLDDGYDMDARGFSDFLQATLSMQEGLVVDLAKFTSITRSMLVRDIKMTAAMRPKLQGWVKEYPDAVAEAIDATWDGATRRQYDEWEFVPLLDDPCWVTTTVRALDSGNLQTIHLHLIQGHLLLDGQTVGKLPTDITDSATLKELFGNQRLFALPSDMADMQYVLAFNKEGHQIHIGFRNEELVVRARRAGSVIELVPRHVFGIGEDLDLPAALIENCVHWVDLKTGLLQIRRKSHLWNDKFWTVDVHGRRAQRNRISLIDQRSNVLQSIARIFRDFEEPHNLLVTQTWEGHICVELKRMNLSFQVNRKGLLQCKQLPAEVDPNQDAGTFYGLQSMLVLRNVYNRAQQSIIVPLGLPEYRKMGIHLVVRIRNPDGYARYTVDNVLGRLQSPQDLPILYTKALLHAYTSFPIPDPLTGRTGTEEALFCLQSGDCQPWMPIAETEQGILRCIANLTPQRHYYPKNTKRQQNVQWNSGLPAFIQHDAYWAVVDSITSKSRQLSQFYLDATEPHPDLKLETLPVEHLRKRALWRRSLYERSVLLTGEPTGQSDLKYISRGGWISNKRISNVREIVKLINVQPSSIHTTFSLAKVFQRWPLIGGYTTTFKSLSLEDCLSIQPAHHWGGLIKLCRQCSSAEKYKIIFQLGLVAFRDGIDMTVLRVIVAFFVLEELKTVRLPPNSSFTNFKNGEIPTHEMINKLAAPFLESFQVPTLPPRRKKNHNLLPMAERVAIARTEHEKKCDQAMREFSNNLISQWPCLRPSVEDLELEGLDVAQAASAVYEEWGRIYANLELANHASEVQQILKKHFSPENPRETTWAPLEHEIFGKKTRCDFRLPQLENHLLCRPGPLLDVYQCSLSHLGSITASTSSISRQIGDKNAKATKTEVLEIERIVEGLLDSECPVKRKYSEDLMESITSLKKIDTPVKAAPEVNFGTEVGRINAAIWAARAAIEHRRGLIAEALSRNDPRHVWLEQCNLWPSMGPIALLQQLRSTIQSRSAFGPGMKMALVSYGQSILELQRLIRIKQALAKKDNTKLQQELETRGHRNWRPYEFPDWLLLELDANIILRDEQVTVALEMIDPNSGANSVLQMNMGQGKTSVIMPMVASILANGEMLTRLLVPKALLSQTAQILQSRLGGLLGRQITHIPFSRRTPTTQELITHYQTIHENIRRESGILLAIPEHVLSFKLSGLQRVSDGQFSEATAMVATQDWITCVSRDVIDECDFSLAVRTQLIYPSGSQLAVDGHPHRWEIVMDILSLIARHLPDLAHEMPRSIEVVNRADFPVAHFLRKDAEIALVERLVNDICNGQASILPVHRYAGADLAVVRTFISEEIVDLSTSDCTAGMFSDQPHVRKMLYLVRGLLVHGILLLCLKKRWNVQYGLHPERDPMAVPFLAKGVPSEQAEWGHPDVAILFTCLAFYHEGLTVKQLRQALQAVLRSDDPTAEYDRWTLTANTLPESLRYWNILNIDDDGQIHELWRHIRFQVAAINYFLKAFVFPAHAKQFSIKLQASGWDLPLLNNSHQSNEDNPIRGAGITTGFSGTNDNRRLLPLTIRQNDLPELAHTNAEVLTYLLQTRNRQYMLAARSDDKRFSELDLLAHLKEKRIRVLIDAGAFILEMDNRSLASAWLQQDQDALVAVYFAEDNKPWVLYRTGKASPLIATPYLDNMDKCLVYLDEAHTRGTDLKLPLNARGALTLALHQTKDHTVQAAMRLRQLGTTQSITFVAPPEVHQSILDVRRQNKRGDCRLDSSDVVAWLLDQTCAANRDLLPLHYAQGADFCYRMQAAARYERFLTKSTHRDKFLRLVRQAEQQTLEQLYDPRSQKNREASISREASGFHLEGELRVYMDELSATRHLSQDLSLMKTSALEEVEQEREVAYEVQEERQLQRPRRQKALEFPGVNETILEFVRTGFLKGSSGYMKASKALLSTELARKHQITALPFMPRLYASAELTRTIKLREGERNDNFARPINWILWSMTSSTALVIIPEEAEAIIPVLRTLENPSVHLILYAAPFTRRMLQFNRLRFYAIPELPKDWHPPSWLSFELGILAGRLYFEFEEYQDIMDRLQLDAKDGSNGESSGSLCLGNRLDKKHLQFLQEWLTLRRHGQDISHTPMGYVCQGWRLRDDHPFFSTQEGERRNATELFPRASQANGTISEQVFYDSDEEDLIVFDAGDDAESDHGDAIHTLAEGEHGPFFVKDISKKLTL
ncbi:uncharacterized protein ACLA_053000 [Aspergillus clavatus NRRL 1]|uniref:ubiquitinyl hydrolase 1 n=1 Tax=Aspergillus clavatus (strain ATCC 1007 / CBS 513.65 / DSM 816 / NCTC 3887 / NRRL 1 / QM 1276 / 107) TaxID=344612 RepID=A1CIX1_ASPCL|nr:uncharacterized protein ACLA_053000 [Aspergillus clavatus NRRL 1]EAW10826.1 conserved hypothetical protein [Aspergillus clavatus NRRL 1]